MNPFSGAGNSLKSSLYGVFLIVSVLIIVQFRFDYAATEVTSSQQVRFNNQKEIAIVTSHRQKSIPPSVTENKVNPIITGLIRGAPKNAVEIKYRHPSGKNLGDGLRINTPILNVMPNYPWRFGNCMMEYIFWRLMALQNSVATDRFEAHKTYIWINNVATCCGPTCLIYPFNHTTPYKQEFIDVGYDKFNDPLPEYPLDHKLFLGKIDIIKSFFVLPPIKREFDLLLHIRMEDIFNQHPAYTLLPLSVFKAMLSNVRKKEGMKIGMVGFCIDDLQVTIMNHIRDYVKMITKVSHIEMYYKRSVSEDVFTLMTATELIGSTSSFWYFPSLLSPFTKVIHVPLFGETMTAHDLGAQGFDRIPQGYESDGKKFYTYRVPLGNKIVEQEWRRMFDLPEFKPA